MKLKTIVLIPMLFATQIAVAGSYTDVATVASVEDVYRTYTTRQPYQDCYVKEFYQAQGDGSATNEIMAGVVGGLVGNQFGGGSGKDIMTVVGTLLGASLAHDDELKKSAGKVVSKEICNTKYKTESIERLSHYRVEYEYDGRVFTYTTKNRPQNDTIQIKIGVSPK